MSIESQIKSKPHFTHHQSVHSSILPLVFETSVIKFSYKTLANFYEFPYMALNTLLFSKE